jgi:hypothetical protein
VAESTASMDVSSPLLHTDAHPCVVLEVSMVGWRVGGHLIGGNTAKMVDGRVERWAGVDGACISTSLLPQLARVVKHRDHV